MIIYVLDLSSPQTELLPRKNAEEEIHAEDGEDPRNNLHLLLSQVKPPKVCSWQSITCLAFFVYKLFFT